MAFIVNLLVTLVALAHIGFMALEMYFWTRPLGLRIFGRSIEFAQASASLAANQGLYNGFLAAGLFWGLFHSNPAVGKEIQVFFLVCVTIAGLYGAYSVSKTILIFQALPAIITLVLLSYLNRTAQ